jgi:phage-related tail fiber protein
MAQSDQSVQNATFPSVRADINDNLAALFSQSSGNSAPSVTVAFQPWVDTSSSPPVWKVRNGSNSAWITVGVLDPAGFSVSGSPTGQIIYVALSSAPTGYLKANGAAVSRTTYAALFTAIGTTFGVGDGSTTFNVPDLRGEFIRGWDDSRGVDASRTLGTAQSDSFKSHSHRPSTNATNQSWEVPANTGAFTSAYSGAVSVNNAPDTGLTGDTETRPRNVALLACIKF